MKLRFLFTTLACALLLTACHKDAPLEQVKIVLADENNPRIEFAAEKLTAALAGCGYTIVGELAPDAEVPVLEIVIGTQADALMQQAGLEAPQAKEAFRLNRQDQRLYVLGYDASGALYGCMELCDRLEADKRLPAQIDFSDQPEMVLRGTCIGVQKTYWLPGRKVYEYPYTEELFPWFYDKDLWIEYLDMLVENRMNSLYLWNGHPFASLVKLPDYPYALEVSEEDFQKNEEIFSFLTTEANKRGIWVIQMFYNIIVSQPFAEHHGIPTQNRNVVITPLLSDYTRKSVAAFIEKYPNVGLLVCLGEAMNTWDDDVNWFTKTIIPGVQDGLKALGIEQEPPIVLRAHDTNCKMVMDAALPIYKNLYTMNKYNGESLCTYEPRGPWTETHRSLSSLGSVHIDNVHILANLEPFRYGSPDFIQKSIKAMHEVHGGNGLHLYPQASYWDWPYTADKLADGSRLKEMERDWIWYQAWGRYAWKDGRDRNDEIDYWCRMLGEQYGCSHSDARRILEAYEQAGEISPKLLRKFGITEGNRQCFLLGMFMSQLVNPTRWTVYPDFANSCGPLGEKLEVWAEKEWKGEAHEGTDLPPLLIAQTREHARLAVKAIDKVKSVSRNADEFARLKNDIHCYEAFTTSFDYKLEAAMAVLRYKYSNDLADLDKAYALMEKSLNDYRRLVDLTRDTYLYANSMQTSQRRIPASGANGRNKEWWELLPQFEQELANFGANIQKLKDNQAASTDIKPFEAANVKIVAPEGEWVELAEGASLFYDRPETIMQIAPELKGLKALRTNTMVQRDANTEIEFSCQEPVTLWVGYYRAISPSNRYMQAPRLETDATANDYGQADIKIANALEIGRMPAVNVHSYQFAAGQHKLQLGRGMCLVLGFSKQVNDFKTRDAGLKESTSIDWLFY